MAQLTGTSLPSVGCPRWIVAGVLLAMATLTLLGAGCRDGAGAPEGTPADASRDGERSRVRPIASATTAETTDALLKNVARETGLDFSGGGEDLPVPPGDLAAMPPAKRVRVIAEGAGLVPVVDADAVENGRGGLHVTARFLLAGTSRELADLVRRLEAAEEVERAELLDVVARESGDLRPLIVGGVLATDASGDVRAEAATLLGEDRDDRAVDALIAALGDDDPFVVESARASLVLMGDAYVRPALLSAARYGAPRVRQAARAILDENFGVELDPDTETAGPAGTVVNAVVVHDLEGRVSCVRLDAKGGCELLVHARFSVRERRAGTLDTAPALLEALALCGATEPPASARAPDAGLVREPDDFVVHLVEADGSRHHAVGDLRDRPPAVRAAIAAVIAAARNLPESSPSATYVVARAATAVEAEGAATFPTPTEDRALLHALESPGWPVACDATRLESLFGDSIGPWLVRWRDGHAELTTLRGATGDDQD